MRRGLIPVMEGREIVRAEVRRGDLRWPLPADLAERLSGVRVGVLRRRSKYILAELSTSETLIVHLGMSGRMLVADETPGAFHRPQTVAPCHDHIVLHMEGGTTVTFNDARRFGMVDLARSAALDDHWLLKGLGPEPLGNAFHDRYLHAHLRGRTASIKAMLMDQRAVAGLGNIYACEALHLAGISPRRRAGRISATRISALVAAIRATLLAAISAGGSSLRDYRRTDGELGYFQHSFGVYGREGEPCRRPGCDGRVRRIVQSGRSSFYCATCQR